MERRVYGAKAEDLNDDDDASWWRDPELAQCLDIEVSYWARCGRHGPERQVGAVECSRVDARHSYNDKDNEKHVGWVILGIVKARSVAGGTAIYLVLDRPDFAYNIRKAKHMGY